jgi:MFS family permease
MGLLAGVPVGALVEGRLGDAIGLRPTVVASAVALFVFVVLALVSFHGLRAIDLDLTHEELDEGEEGEEMAPAGEVPIAPAPAVQGAPAIAATSAASGLYPRPMPRRP